MSKFGSPKCPACGKAVYFAERQKVIGQDWHKVCVKCNTCKKKLEPGNFSDREGKIYCKTCYNAAAGIAGYGYGNSQSSYQSYGKGESVLDPGDGSVRTMKDGAAPASGNCSNCGTATAAGARFCGGCGTQLV
mmetsp:Transcript_115304/g.162115  ORF Transcript_115304/g.162115 Transcript_115304/m.162115 type:complete len:133 (-) Transcript_115304:23-421(-)